MEKAFVAYGVPDDRKVDYAAYMMRSVTLDWWRSAKDGLLPRLTWNKFLGAYYKRFFLDNK